MGDAAAEPGGHARDRAGGARGGRRRQLKTSEGEHGTVFVLGRDQGENATPSVVLAGEHYNMIARMLERGMPVKLRVNVQSHFVTDDPNSYNVIARICPAPTRS